MADRSLRSGLRLPVYLDYQATTPLDPRVLDAMLPYYRERFGNPHSINHAYGAEAEAAVDDARARIAALIGAEAREIVFTSGATESNNLALKGVAHFERAHRKGRRNRLVAVVTEHKCVLETCGRLAREGFAVSYLPVRSNGLIDLDRLRDTIDDRTLSVSVMGVNNEIGVIQPLAEIGAICRERGVHFHSDCAQAVGKIPVDVEAMNIDLLSLSGHKIYAPKGIGVLYVRRRPRVRLVPLIDGGGQERGLRSGTLPVPLCVGLGEACAIAAREMTAEATRIRALRDRLYDGIRARTPGVTLSGDAEKRIPGNLNLSFAGLEGEAILLALRDIAVSTGSACTSALVEPSYVLRALGLDDLTADASIRFGIGRFTTEAEIDFAVETVVEQIARLRGAATSRESA
ncbi:MAG: IscS subfamily cysteine desulfurase [Alphaproteobacteria bacterium]